MSYVVIARKYRPQTFDEVVGQQPIATTLKNAIRSDRVAHAYLFAGPRGVGKTSMARIFAKALNCVDGPTETPCNQCEICRAVGEGSDIDVLEIDGASNNGVEEVRELRQNVKYVPNRSHYKIYIIDEVHMLSTAAFNALLKTLEEPPPHVKFIFATTQPRKVPDTIQSRCQRFDFHRVTTIDIVARLRQICEAEGIAFEPNVLETIARSVRGGMRDSQSILDQLVAFSDGPIKLADVHEVLGIVPENQIAGLVDDLVNGDAGGGLAMVDKLFADGHDVGEFLDQTQSYLRDIMVALSCGADSALIDRSDESRAKLGEQAKQLSLDSWMYMLQVLAEVKRRTRENVHSRVLLELAVMKLARLEDLKPLSEIADRLKSLEARLGSGGAPTSGVGAPRPAPSPRTQPTATPAPRAATHPQAQPTAPPPAKAHAPEELAQLWPQVVQRVAAKKRMLGEMLGAGRLGAVTAQRATFQAASSGHVGFLTTPDSRGMVEEAIQAVLGQRLQLKVEAGAEPAPAPNGQATRPAAPKTSKTAILDHPVVRDAIDRFGGRVTGVDT